MPADDAFPAGSIYAELRGTGPDRSPQLQRAAGSCILRPPSLPAGASLLPPIGASVGRPSSGAGMSSVKGSSSVWGPRSVGSAGSQYTGGVGSVNGTPRVGARAGLPPVHGQAGSSRSEQKHAPAFEVAASGVVEERSSEPGGHTTVHVSSTQQQQQEGGDEEGEEEERSGSESGSEGGGEGGNVSGAERGGGAGKSGGESSSSGDDDDDEEDDRKLRQQQLDYLQKNYHRLGLARTIFKFDLSAETARIHARARGLSGVFSCLLVCLYIYLQKLSYNKCITQGVHKFPPCRGDGGGCRACG